MLRGKSLLMQESLAVDEEVFTPQPAIKSREVAVSF